MPTCTKCNNEKPIDEFKLTNMKPSLWCWVCILKAREKRQRRIRRREKYIVYGLCDPRTEECRYVGASAQSEVRLTQHIIDARNSVPGKSAKCDWICELIDNGLKPEMRTLEEVTAESVEAKEQYWINKLLNAGVMLTNSHGYTKQELAERFNRKASNGG